MSSLRERQQCMKCGRWYDYNPAVNKIFCPYCAKKEKKIDQKPFGAADEHQCLKCGRWYKFNSAENKTSCPYCAKEEKKIRKRRDTGFGSGLPSLSEKEVYADFYVV